MVLSPEISGVVPFLALNGPRSSAVRFPFLKEKLTNVAVMAAVGVGSDTRLIAAHAHF